MIFLAHFNHDYREWTVAKASRAEAVAVIADAFGITAPPEDEDHADLATYLDTPAFWREVADTYESGNWKGLTFQTLDPVTLELHSVTGSV
jgi:hypothetical protein